MLAEAPEIVRSELIPTSDDPDRTEGLVFAHPVNRTSLNGVTGTPSRARVEDGHELFAWMVDDLSALIEQGRTEQPPLSHPYFVPSVE
jgi:creatinine amidohydrolase